MCCLIACCSPVWIREIVATLRKLEIGTELALTHTKHQRKLRLESELDSIVGFEIDELIEDIGESDLGRALATSVQQSKEFALGFCEAIALRSFAPELIPLMLRAASRACQQYEAEVKLLESCRGYMAEQQGIDH